MGQTNNDCRFLISTLTRPLRQQPLLAGRYGSRPRYVLVHNFLQSHALDQRSGLGWFSGWTEIFVIYSWYFNAKFWSTWCEDFFGTEQNHPYFQWRISLEEQRAQQIASLIYDQFRVTGTHDSVENYTDLFSIVLRNDDIQEFDSKWDGILLSMTKIPHGGILEGLYKLRIRESEKLKTVLELYDLETQKKLGPDFHRLKAMVKRSIEQEIRNKNFGARSGNFEKNAVVKKPGNKTACTKNSWRLLAMGNQRAMCERKQL